MEIGDTFLPADRGLNDHLHVIISDPAANPDKVVFVALTSYETPEQKKSKDGSCVLLPGDHPWVAHETCVSYRDGRVVADSVLDDLVAKGRIKTCPPVSDAVLTRILQGAEKTDELPNKCRIVLLDQRLIAS